jgi:hypothetical protein
MKAKITAIIILSTILFNCENNSDKAYERPARFGIIDYGSWGKFVLTSADNANWYTRPGYDEELGHGRINAGRALEYMNEPWEIVHHTSNGSYLFTASNKIESGVNILYSAGAEVFLNEGFEVEVGAEFTLKMTGCQ